MTPGPSGYCWHWRSVIEATILLSAVHQCINAGIRQVGEFRWLGSVLWVSFNTLALMDGLQEGRPINRNLFNLFTKVLFQAEEEYQWGTS